LVCAVIVGAGPNPSLVAGVGSALFLQKRCAKILRGTIVGSKGG